MQNFRFEIIIKKNNDDVKENKPRRFTARARVVSKFNDPKKLSLALSI